MPIGVDDGQHIVTGGNGALCRVMILVGVLMAACAAPADVYDKPRVTPARLAEDLAACRQEAFRPSRFALFAWQRYDRSVLNRCMERKGYAVRRED